MREHIVILGGGFGGWSAARGLAVRLGPDQAVTLVDRVDHLLYTPMLTEVAGGNLRPGSVAVSFRSLPRKVRVVRGDVAKVDLSTKVVTLADGQVLQATQLVFALGSEAAYHHIEGAEANSLPLKTLKDATETVARVDALVAEASRCDDEKRRRELLTLVVAGGGYTGVEAVAAVAEHLRRKASSAGLNPEEVQTVLIEVADRLMLETPAPLAEYSRVFLEKNGVRVMLKTGVKKVDGGVVTLESGEEIHAGLLLWDTGIEPSPLLQQVGLPLGKHHGVVVDACFRVQGQPGVWAIGDCAEVPKPDGGTYAATAQNATREGALLASNISRVLLGRTPLPFRFRMLGQLAILSEKKAVAEILGVQITGFVAWAMWWVIYIAKVPSMRGRVGVIQDLVTAGKQTGVPQLGSGASSQKLAAR